MRNLSVWIVLTLVVSAGGLASIHYKAMQEGDRRVSRLTPIYERQAPIARMTLELERYRRQSGSFHKLSNADIAAAKDKLKSELSGGIAKLEQLDPTPEEHAHAAQLGEQVNSLLVQSAKIEPTLFLRDAYIRPEIRTLHDEMLSNLAFLDRSAKARAATMTASFGGSTQRSTELILAVAGLMVALSLVLILRNYMRFGRPLAKLHKYARDLRNGGQASAGGPNLSGMFGEIEIALHELASRVDAHRNERHKFIQDVVADLKSPLAMLQAGKSLVASVALPAATGVEESQQADAADSVRRGISLLSGSLDDLLDITELGRLESRLDEHVVDIPELVSDIARGMSGSGIATQITTSLPAMPVWMRIDDRRFSRVLIQLLTKMASVDQGEAGAPRKVHITVTAPQPGRGFNGVMITVADGDRTPGRGRAAAGGPEQDLPRHWVSDTGFGMTLAHKIIKAHGGTITAAGVAGMSLQFTIKLPAERLANGLLAPTDQPTRGGGALESSSLEGAEIRRLVSASLTEAPASTSTRPKGSSRGLASLD